MNDLRQAAEQALEALACGDTVFYPQTKVAITALRAALAEPVQEPVAWMYHGIRYDGAPNERLSLIWRPEHMDVMSAEKGAKAVPLYAAPPQRKPLTDEEIDRVTDQQWAANNHKPIYAAHRAYARAIERAHGIGDSDG